MATEPGILYLVATPIGNLEDLSPRALRVLSHVDVIAAEDTRVSLKLLNHFDIKKPLLSYFAPREKEKALILAAKLKEGKNIALISDAGTPGISDPAFELVNLARELGSKVVPIPGPAAFITGLVASGLPTERFYFEGFLPAKRSEREKALGALKDLSATLIFYEAPHRLLECLKDMERILGDRRVAICRELTKVYEEIQVFPLSEHIRRLETRAARGEFTLIVEGAPENAFGLAPVLEKSDVAARLEQLTANGRTLNEAIALVAKESGLARKEVYKIGHRLN